MWDDPRLTIDLPLDLFHAGAHRGATANVRLFREGGRGAVQDWNVCIEQVMAELAFCEFKGWRHDELPEDYVVRTTHKRSGRLVIHRNDHPDKMYVLLTGRHGRYVIKGWKLGRDAMQSHWWKDPTGLGRDAYFVPQKQLVQFDEAYDER